MRLIAIIVAAIVFALLPLFVTSPYYIDLLISIIVHAVLAITFVMCLKAGMINMGISAFWGIGAYVSALLVMKLGVNFWLSLPLTTIITGLIAIIFGYILIGSGSSGFGFVILSSIIGMMFTTAVGNIAYVGGTAGIRNIPAPNPIQLPFLPPIEFSVVNKASFYYLALFLFIIIILIIKGLFASRIGRAWNAIGLNPQLGGSIGVNIFGYKMAVFVVSSAFAGLIGSFFAHYMSFVTPDTYGMWVNIYVQVYSVLGGLGYLIMGPIIGSAVMTVVPEFLRQWQDYAPVILGVVLILLILFLPNGLMGIADSLKNFINKRSNNSTIGEKSGKSDIAS